MQKKRCAHTTSDDKSLRILKTTTLIARVVVAVALFVNVIYAFNILVSRELLSAFGLGVVITSMLFLFVTLWW